MIKVRISETQRCRGEYSLFVSFDFDMNIVDILRGYPVRYYNGDTHEWELPYKDLEYLKSDFKDYSMTFEDERVNTHENEKQLTVSLESSENDIGELLTQYKFKTEPFDHQITGFEFGAFNKRWLLSDEQGLGKALALNTKIYTYPTGYKLMRDIEVGDYVYDKNGVPTKVTATYYHKNVEMYRFTFSDGVSIDCCKDHLWKINTQHGCRVVDTNWFLQKNQFGIVRKDKLFSDGSYNYYIDRCNPVQFKFTPVKIQPYVIGALLGDGCLSGGSISFTNKDEEIINRINSNLPNGYILHSSKSMENITYNVVRLEHTTKPNIIKQHIKDLGLLNTNSHNKFIPDIYKYNSPKIRLAVLQGLLDTDGYATKDNLIQYTTVSKQLAEDVRFMVESLGGMCTWREGHCGYNGKTTSITYTITIKVNDPSQLFKLARKKTLLKPRHFKPRRQIVSIEKIDNADAKCITVDSKDHLYLAEHFVVTHNTKQAIDIACLYKQSGYKHCLIICGVNGLKWNWQNEIKIHSDEQGHILGQRTNRNGNIVVKSSKEKLEDLSKINELPYFLITNVESLRNKDILNKLVKLCKKGDINMCVADECHKMKNPTSQQGKAFLKINTEYKLAITGTPLMNTPLDLYIILKWLGYEEHAFYAFKNHYCIMGGFGGYEIVGYKNLKEIHNTLDEMMLRRLKADVLDLPEKLFVSEYVDMTPKQEVIYREVNNQIKANIDQIMLSPNPLANLIRLRQATGYTGILSSEIQESAKLDRMEELVEEAVANGRKVVIFSNWTQMTDVVQQRLKKYKGVAITGETNDAMRMFNVNEFQNNPKCNYIVGTIGAMGTGLTLTAGTVEIFLDEPWNRALLDQAVDRCHRVGTKENITIYTLMCKNTIDERIHSIVETKGAMSDVIVDGKITKDKQELIKFLLN